MGRPVYAVVGATGAVGTEMLEIFESRLPEGGELRLFASERSKGKKIKFRGRELPVDVLSPGSFAGVSAALFDASNDVSKRWIPEVVKAGAFAVDNSSAFRLDPEMPLVVPEVNGDLLKGGPKVVAGPNCTTIPLVMVLEPVRRAAGLKRVVLTTYQAISGAGAAAARALKEETREQLDGKPPRATTFSHPAAFNCVFHEKFEAEGYTDEEWKIMKETRKILGAPDLPVAVTAVRVPVFQAHSEAVFIETERPLAPQEARRLLSESPGLKVVDDPSKKQYPTPLAAQKQDEVYVGRIRKDLSVPNGLALWLSCDNLRKGAALNAVQIAERLLG